jgi:HEAT repeat protein
MSHVLLEGSPEARVAAMAALAGRDAPPRAAELDALRDCLGDARKLVQRRAAEAFAALAARGVEVRELLRATLAAPELRQRWGAAYALARAGALSGEALPTLLAVIAVDDGDLRWAAAELLKQLARTDCDAVAAALIAAARRPGAARKMALYCLRDLAVAEAHDAAIDALADAHLETRLAALAVLAKVHRDAGATAARVAALIDDPDPRMRRTAAATLGDLGVRSADVLEALRRAAASDDESLCRAAQRSLARLSP